MGKSQAGRGEGKGKVMGEGGDVKHSGTLTISQH